MRTIDITLPTKVCLVKAIVFPVVMYGCESWAIKTAECRRIEAFELWCWRRLLRVSRTARRSNQSILKEISPEYSLEGLMWKLKFPILWPLDAKSWLIWKDRDAGKDWVQEEKGTTEDEMVRWHHWLNGHGFGWIQGVGDGQGDLVCCSSWGQKELDMTECLNWTDRMCNSNVQFSRSVVSDSLRPHGLQHTRSPCPSPTPGAYSKSFPLSADAI